jgi:hypothetical protein
MPVSALVVTFAEEPRLAPDPRLILGAPVGGRLPVVATTATSREGAELIAELEATPGVLAVDVVMIDFSDEEELA